MMRHFLQHKWYRAFLTVSDFEERSGEIIHRRALMRLMRVYGLPAGFTIHDFERVERAVKAANKMRIPVDRVDGIEPWYILQISKWYDEGIITHRDAVLLCFYRQRFFFGGNLASKDTEKRTITARGAGMFAAKDEDERDTLIRAARRCEKFLSLL